ncbi:hypothetical protein FOZ61_005621 [Perkinsus olseni]|uniref:Band 7 domain-containing protein n=1 Tax=Perkinsus olseni TaxID=32597 RepID=A0A7J6MBS5_PEROL|nr:hypothetical protein FOZ61_005621 [Perkinsus olseni]KAF4674282.1 hypothetical protein FOL46_005458 [Perkinsus olseni]
MFLRSPLCQGTRGVLRRNRWLFDLTHNFPATDTQRFWGNTWQGKAEWLQQNWKNLVICIGSVGIFLGGFLAVRVVPGQHVALVVDRLGNVKPYVYDSSQAVLIIPFWQRLVSMREIPAKKRFIKEFVTKDDRNVEIRMLCSISAKVHWMPEIYYKFGKDFGRGFLEREATIDVEEVVRKYTLEELLEDGEPLDKAIAEIKLRLDDAAAYHKVSFDHAETTIVFVDPEVDDEDEY